MKHAKTTAVLLGATSVLAAGAWAAEDPFWGQATAERGRIVYRANCVGCHGDEGDGQGPAADTMFPAPRDLTAAEYRFLKVGIGGQSGQNLEHGALLEAAWLVGKALRVGAGYNFSKFAETAAGDIERNEGGFFLRMIGMY